MLLASGGHEKIIAQFAKGLLRHTTGFLPDSWGAAIDGSAAAPADGHLEQAGRFLSMLRIDEGKPSRTYVGHAAPDMYCGPILRVLGQDVLIAASCDLPAAWDHLRLVLARSMGPPGLPVMGPPLLGSARLSGSSDPERSVRCHTGRFQWSRFERCCGRGCRGRGC